VKHRKFSAFAEHKRNTYLLFNRWPKQVLRGIFCAQKVVKEERRNTRGMGFIEKVA